MLKLKPMEEKRISNIWKKGIAKHRFLCALVEFILQTANILYFFSACRQNVYVSKDSLAEDAFRFAMFLA